MKENNYITIPGFLRTRLDLKGSELIITALIYGYSQDGNSWFMGKAGYIAEWAGITDKKVLRSLKSLTEKGILEKKEVFVNNKAKRCYYRFNFECVESQNGTVSGCQNSTAGCQNGTVAGYQNGTDGCQKGTVAGCQKGTVNNNIYNNNIYNNNIKAENEFSVFSDESQQSNTPQKLRGTTEPRKCLFANSRFAKFDDFNGTVNNNIDNNISDNNIKPENEFSVFSDESQQSNTPQKLRGTTEPRMCLFANSRFAKFDDFERCFDKPEFEQIDILYYYHSVADWSASKGRMQKDWIAQTRNFIRGDKEKGKLHLKPEYKAPTQKLNVAGAIEYLKGDY